jgi:hypothetical protein
VVVVLPESVGAEDTTVLADEADTTEDQALNDEHDEDLCEGVVRGVGAADRCS